MQDRSSERQSLHSDLELAQLPASPAGAVTRSFVQYLQGNIHLGDAHKEASLACRTLRAEGWPAEHILSVLETALTRAASITELHVVSDRYSALRDGLARWLSAAHEDTPA